MPAHGKEVEWDNAMARKRAMALLARREHGRSELETKLVQRGCSRETASQALDELERDGLLSDERFTESLVLTRCNQGHGPVRIRHDLRQKGVADSIINRWLDARNEQWLALISRVRQQKFGDGLPGNYKERARQARFLQSRGFTAEQIHTVLKDDDLA
ncbi:MAG: regulatory protein RecX [Acidiferrobacterales bacterium]